MKAMDFKRPHYRKENKVVPQNLLDKFSPSSQRQKYEKSGHKFSRPLFVKRQDVHD
jgi:hypothetical protein